MPLPDGFDPPRGSEDGGEKAWRVFFLSFSDVDPDQAVSPTRRSVVEVFLWIRKSLSYLTSDKPRKEKKDGTMETGDKVVSTLRRCWGMIMAYLGTP